MYHTALILQSVSKCEAMHDGSFSYRSNPQAQLYHQRAMTVMLRQEPNWPGPDRQTASIDPNDTLVAQSEQAKQGGGGGGGGVQGEK